MPDPVPHEKVKELADNINRMFALHREKYATMATMIRACLDTIDRPKPKSVWDRYEDRRNQQAWTAEQANARKALRDLANMLDKEATKGTNDGQG